MQKKYKDKPQQQREEMMKVYKEAGASPFTALSGCLPMLIPMPVLFALFFVFQNTIEFRGVPFLWLPDISVKDPFYILPLLMGASMYVLSWIGMRNAPPNPQAKMMMLHVPGDDDVRSSRTWHRGSTSTTRRRTLRRCRSNGCSRRSE